MFIKIEMSNCLRYFNLNNVYSVEAGDNFVEILFSNGTMTTLRNGQAVQFLQTLEAEGNVKGA